MVESDRLFNRQRSLHQILGGGLVADVVLWRRRDLTLRILVLVLAVWMVFEISGYTLLSLVSSVFLLLFTILFLWAKSAAILNRPAPPLPDFYISEDSFNEVAAIVRNNLNVLLSISQDIALGKDSRMFIKVAACLLLVSVIGSLTDIVTLGYTSLVIILTAPALYERCEDLIDRFVLWGCKKLRHLYTKFHAEGICRVQNWILEMKKLS